MLEPMSKLTPFIESVEDCDNCVIIRMKPGCGSELVKLGYFKGTEIQFRLMKYEPVRLNLLEGERCIVRSCVYTEYCAHTTCWHSNGVVDEPDAVNIEISYMLIEALAWDYNVDMLSHKGRGLCHRSDRLTMPIKVHHLHNQSENKVMIIVNGVDAGGIPKSSEAWINVQIPASVLQWFAKLAPHVDIHAELEQKLQHWVGVYTTDSIDAEANRLARTSIEDPVELSVATPEQLKEILTESEQEQLRKKTVKVGGYFQIDIEQRPAGDGKLSGWELTVTSADPLNHPVEKHMFISTIEVGDRLGLSGELPKVVVTDYRPKSERESEIRFAN